MCKHSRIDTYAVLNHHTQMDRNDSCHEGIFSNVVGHKAVVDDLEHVKFTLNIIERARAIAFARKFSCKQFCNTRRTIWSHRWHGPPSPMLTARMDRNEFLFRDAPQFSRWSVDAWELMVGTRQQAKIRIVVCSLQEYNIQGWHNRSVNL